MDNPPMPPRELNAVGGKTGPTRRVSPPEAPTNQRGWYERLGRPGSRSLDLPIGTGWNRWVGGVEIALQAAYGNSEMRTDEPRDHESPSIKPGILPLPSRVCVLSCISIHTRFPRKHHTSTTANMRFQTALAVIGLSSLPATQAISGKSYTGWDCCKPACAWSANLKNVQFVPLLFFISCQLLVLTTPPEAPPRSATSTTTPSPTASTRSPAATPVPATSATRTCRRPSRTRCRTVSRSWAPAAAASASR